MFLQIVHRLNCAILFIGIANGDQLLGERFEALDGIVANGLDHALLPAGGAEGFEVALFVDVYQCPNVQCGAGCAHQFVDAPAHDQPFQIPQRDHVDHMLGEVLPVLHQFFKGCAVLCHMGQLQNHQSHAARACFRVDHAHVHAGIFFLQVGCDHLRQIAAAGQHGGKGQINKILPGSGIFFKQLCHAIRRNLGGLGQNTFQHGLADLCVVDLDLVQIFLFAQAHAQRQHIHIIGFEIRRVQITDAVRDNFYHKNTHLFGISFI